MMRLFSSRRESITAALRDRAAQFERRYGRAPSQRELAQLAQSANFATRKSKEGALDFAQLHAGWADRLARTLGVPLASVAPEVWHAGADAHSRRRRPSGRRRADRGPGRHRAGARGAAGADAGAAGEVGVDPGGPGQAPGPGPAPDRPGPGSRREAAGGDRRPDPAVGVREGAVPGGPRPGRPAGRAGPRGRPQRLPAPRRHPVRHPRAAEHGGGHGRAGAGVDRAAHDPRGRRGRARRGPCAARARAGRGRGRGRAATQTTRAPVRGCAWTRPRPRWRCWPTGGGCR